ncbi:AraC-type DNA-binding protein [Mucilaginibacter pineti]|uniref:AraC-type DNA-binding protein n=1 Tax=Mucilaginibacter pineti TaxID=1391627 RepID=A0A1G6U6S8_9SPHI|nr:AraC family transcriptional regulator [Mucilaginibacter pineti]SDD37132.1 AraC-type DNA-binding protein [Mucilaginibacter pineti]
MLRITTPFIPDLVFLPIDMQPDGVKISQAHKISIDIDLLIKEIKLEGIVLLIIDLKCGAPLPLKIQINESILLMNFMLSGWRTITTTVDRTETIMKEGSYHIRTLPDDSQFNILANGDLKLLIVCLAFQDIRKLLTAKVDFYLQNNNSDVGELLKTGLINMPMNEIIITTTRYIDNNSLHPILLAAKMLELLFLSMEQFDRAGLSPVKSNDFKKLELAKTLIAENLQTPCSLIELSRKVGLNDFKLKKGFKEAFGNTVFGYLLELRMEKAKDMLLLPNQSVSEVAHKVGYKNAHHFTVAFKKRFGYLPSKINRLLVWVLLSIALVA